MVKTTTESNMLQKKAMNRYKYYTSNPNNILLSEFKYYNTKTQIIPPKVLAQMEKDVVTEKKKFVFWTNKTFGNNKIGFIVYKGTVHFYDDKKETDLYIRMQKFTGRLLVNAFKDLEEIFLKKIFVSFKLTEEEKNILRGFDLSKYYHPQKNGVIQPPFASFQEIIDYFIVSGQINKFYRCEETEFPIYQHIIKTLFKKEITLPKIAMQDKRTYFYSANVYYIFDVIERRINNKNYRIALTSCLNEYKDYCLICVPEDNDNYVYIDKNRLTLDKTTQPTKQYFFAEETNEYRDGHIIIDLDLIKEISSNIQNILREKEKVITPMIYRFYRERVLATNFSYGAKTEKEKKIRERYKKLLKEDKAIKINNVYLQKEQIMVSGEGFSLQFQKDFLDIIGNFDEIKDLIKSDTIYNFNEFYEGLLKISKLQYLHKSYYHYDKYRNFKKTKFTINDMKIVVNNESTRLKINDIFCRIDDVIHILSKCICYTDVNEFNKYIKEVSYIGIDWKKMISNGIALELTNPMYSTLSTIVPGMITNLYLRFSMFWDTEKRSQIYLSMAGKKYLIRYKGKFKRLFNVPKRNITIERLKRDLKDCLQDLDDNILIEIIDNAVKEAEIVKKRGKELVVNTIKDIKAVEESVSIQGKEILGYTFVGRASGSKYFVEKNQLTVYRYDNGNWNRRCIVDDHTKQRIYEDRLANRLINIYNEPTYLKSFLSV